MNRNNHDLIGSALGFPGAWGPGWGGWGPAAGTVAFGVDEFAAQQVSNPALPAILHQMEMQKQANAQALAAAMARGNIQPFQGGCAPGVPGYLDPALMNALIAKQHSVIVGSDYGPQETEQMIGAPDVGELEPEASVDLNFTPELVCKLVRLFIPTKCASQLTVEDVTIGIKSQLPGKGRVPGLVYSEVSTNNRINGDTCYIRQPIVVRLKNISKSSCIVEAAVGVVAVQGAGPRIIGPGSGHL